MSINKKGYFQGGGGVNEPTPGQKKYKSDPALVVQPRFEEPFYRNYDVYDVPGQYGPGSGWHEIMKHPSIKEFLNFRRQRLKGKYVADDSWILDNGKKTKENPGMKARAAIFAEIVKIAGDENDGPNFDYGKGLYSNMDKYKSVKDFEEKADKGPGAFFADDNNIDFPIDEEVNQWDEMIYPDEGSYHNPTLVGPEGGSGDLSTFPSYSGTTDFSSYIESNDIAGEHSYLPAPDAESKSGDALDFGRDYTEDAEFPNNLSEDDLQNLMNKYLSPAEGDMFGLPDGIDPNSDLDAEETVNDENPDQGTPDAGEQMYDDKWNI